MTNNFLIDNFKHLTTTPENVEQLKKLVLQLAVQGKLSAKWREHVKTQNLASPDDPNYNASALLEKIKTEKEQLIKEGKIKKQKLLSPIADEEKPFELPANWSYERLGNYSINRDGRRIPLSKKERENRKRIYDYYGASGVIDKVDDFLFDGEYLLIGEDGANLVARSTPIAFIARGKFWVNNHAHVLECLSITSIDYLSIFINAIDLKPFVTGGFQPKLSQGNLNKIPLLVPPHEEQKAIVSQVEKLFSQIDQLHALAQKRINYREKSAKALFNKINHAENDTELQETWQSLTAHFHTLTQSKESVKQLRQSILQLAVQGKLSAKWREHVKTQNLASPDDPNYNASALLEKIKTEKEQLLKEGKIKRQKPLPPISDEEKPYKVPTTWLFSRMQSIMDVRDGTHDTPKYQNQGIPLVTSKNLSTGRLNISDVKFISKEDHLEISKRSKVDEGDILFAMIGTIGNPVLIKNIEFDFSIKNVALFKQFNYSFFNSEYLLFFLKYISNYLNDNSRGAIQKFVSLKLLRETLIPVPPIKEQKVIVSKVKQLMSWCDELEKKIEKRDTYQHKMMQAVVKQTFNTENKLK